MEFEHLKTRIWFRDVMQRIAAMRVHYTHDLIDGQSVWAD